MPQQKRTHCVHGHEFAVSGRTKQGQCKACKHAYNARWIANNKEKHSVYQRSVHLRRAFGLSAEQYEAMVDAQGGVCAICSGAQPLRFGQRNLFVDHDHTTGKVRALLCHHCNMGLGNFRESPELMQNAMTYLSKHTNKPSRG